MTCLLVLFRGMEGLGQDMGLLLAVCCLAKALPGFVDVTWLPAMSTKVMPVFTFV